MIKQRKRKMDPNYKFAKFTVYFINLLSIFFSYHFKLSFPLELYSLLLLINLFLYEKCSAEPGIVDPEKHVVQIELEENLGEKDNEDIEYPDQHFCDECKIL